MAMLVAAVYAFQNTGEVLVKFLVWELSFPQGIWEVMLFAAGGVLMWLVSLFASVEGRSKYVRQIKEKDARIRDLEHEKTSLMEAIKHSGPLREPEIRAEYSGIPADAPAKEEPATEEPTMENEVEQEGQ